MCLLAGCEPGVRFNPTAMVEEVMKIVIDSDEWYPCYTAEEYQPDAAWHAYSKPKELSEEDWLDYQELMKRFGNWQDKLMKLDKS